VSQAHKTTSKTTNKPILDAKPKNTGRKRQKPASKIPLYRGGIHGTWLIFKIGALFYLYSRGNNS
jgi:hypothetical protein